MDYEKKDIIRESKQLYGDINSCITDLINARIAKDLYNEGRAIFRMEGLMVATMQHLGCVIDFLEEHSECLADSSKTSESEDERARKELINFILYKAGALIDEDTEHRWITWLEKQKEPHYTKRNALFDKCVENCDPKVMKEVSDKVDEMLQKEQKPDSLIYDKDLDKAAREFYLSGGADSPVDSTGLVPIVRMAEFGATWMKERMEKEQKSVESENERMIKAITHILYENYTDAAVIEGVEIAEIVTWLEDRKDHFRESTKMVEPHWKPSEKQIYSLGTVVKGYNECTVGSIGYNLKSLYEQLKKLM